MILLGNFLAFVLGICKGWSIPQHIGVAEGTIFEILSEFGWLGAA